MSDEEVKMKAESHGHAPQPAADPIPLQCAAKNSDAAGTGSDPAVATMSDSDARLLSRFIATYDGEVSDSVTARVTHLVTAEPFLMPRLSALRCQSAGL